MRRSILTCTPGGHDHLAIVEQMAEWKVDVGSISKHSCVFGLCWLVFVAQEIVCDLALDNQRCVHLLLWQNPYYPPVNLVYVCGVCLGN